MDVLLVVDMQVGLLKGPPKHDLAGVVQRINALAGAIRRRSGKVVWIQHCGARGDDFEPKTPGWLFLPELVRFEEDLVAEKTLNDPFCRATIKVRHSVNQGETAPGWTDERRA